MAYYGESRVSLDMFWKQFRVVVLKGDRESSSPINGWMHVGGWMDRQTYGWTDGWTDRQTKRCHDSSMIVWYSFV